MSIALSDGTISVALDKDLYWPDENDWTPVVQSVNRSITGGLIVQPATRVRGRPITLEPEDDSTAWMPRAAVDQLRNWAAVPGKVLTLTLRGEVRSVMFRHQDGGLEATPVVHYRDVVPNDWYLVTVRLMEV